MFSAARGPIRYLSVCSGIEAATVAWRPLGWKAVAFAEIEKFPSAVLAHHYPEVPNFGDITRFAEWPDAALDVLVGGTPCQSFSVAGLRAGLADPRGNLALTYLAIADRYRPEWIVWENVPGVLSSGRGRDFGTFLGALGKLGYGWAYRSFDAQYFGLAQRRKRVFVVAHLGDWRRAAAVLFDGESLSGNPPPRREAGQGVAPTIASRPTGGGGLGTDFDCDGGLIANTITSSYAKNRGAAGGKHSMPHNLISMALNAHGGSGRMDAESETFIAGTLLSNGKAAGSATSQDAESGLLVAFSSGRMDGESETFVPIVAPCLTRTYGRQPDNSDTNAGPMLVTHTLRANGFDAGEDGTGRGTPLIAFDTTQVTSVANRSNPKPGDPCHPLAKGAHPPAVAFMTDQDPEAHGDIAPTLQQPSPSGGGQPTAVMTGMQVRRLTPRECERLQGFPDDYTLVPYRGKPAADGPRYKALGNSMAVPVVRWIGSRIV